MDDNGDLLIDYIGRFENVENDFYEIVSHLNLEDVYLPHTNKSGNEFMVNDYRHFYDEETKEIVRKNHLFDLEFFGYEFDNPNPKKNFGLAIGILHIPIRNICIKFFGKFNFYFPSPLI